MPETGNSAFSLDTFSGKTFLITTSVSFILLVLSTVLGIFQTVTDTTRLDIPQRLICTPFSRTQERGYGHFDREGNLSAGTSWACSARCLMPISMRRSIAKLTGSTMAGPNCSRLRRSPEVPHL